MKSFSINLILTGNQNDNTFSSPCIRTIFTFLPYRVGKNKKCNDIAFDIFSEPRVFLFAELLVCFCLCFSYSEHLGCNRIFQDLVCRYEVTDPCLVNIPAIKCNDVFSVLSNPILTSKQSLVTMTIQLNVLGHIRSVLVYTRTRTQYFT